ncbi:hypothetical protein AMTR_s00006p00269000 [Amborella trichopoda]|uniref:Uncharacterized protein n=1 Tax=Amborella trichopoda TaxID=13333 RepID=W1PDY5_AMBTC|nr:hypothetical protein AMTR_s00006p00269000 [Amborella trichopoda]
MQSPCRNQETDQPNTSATPSLARKVSAMRRVVDLRMQEGSKVDDHALIFKVLISEVESANLHLDDTFQVAAFINTLPQSWETFISSLAVAWERDPTPPTLEGLLAQLKAEEARRAARDSRMRNIGTLRRLFDLKMQEGTKVDDHARSFKFLIQELETGGLHFDDTFYTYCFINMLPHSWDAFISSLMLHWEFAPPACTFEGLLTNLKAEEESRAARDSN